MSHHLFINKWSRGLRDVLSPHPKRIILVHRPAGAASGTVFSCFKEVSDVFKCKDVKHSNYFSAMSKQWVMICQLFKNINFYFPLKKMQSFLEAFRSISVLKKISKQHEAHQGVNPTGQLKGQPWEWAWISRWLCWGLRESSTVKPGEPWCFCVVFLLSVSAKPATQEEQRPSPLCKAGEREDARQHGILAPWCYLDERS